MTQGEVKPFRVLVLDDYEDQAKEVPAFKELSGRAGRIVLITILAVIVLAIVATSVLPPT